MVMALVHAGSSEVQSGRVPEGGGEAALVATVVGAVATSHPRAA